MRVTQRRIDVGDAAFNVREAGRGPLMLFLHGISANAAVWDPVLEELASGYHVVAIDQRGHGLSHRPSSGYAADDFAGDVADLITAIDEGEAVVVGHSLGARNALVAASRIGAPVAAVIAVDFTPFIEAAVFDALAVRVAGGNQVFTTQSEVEDYLRQRYRLLPPDAILRRATHGYRSGPAGIVPLADPDALMKTVEGLREPFDDAVRDVKQPVLLVRGEQSTLVSAEAFEQTLALRPDFSSLVVPDTDHYVPEEAPHDLAKAIAEFDGVR